VGLLRRLSGDFEVVVGGNPEARVGNDVEVGAGADLDLRLRGGMRLL